jgi:hypothetical protein
MSDTGRTAPGEHGALVRFAARLAEIEPSAAAAITAVPTDRNEHERAAYIGAWQRVEAAGARTRTHFSDAAAISAVMAAGPELGRLGSNDQTDRRPGLLALGVARALALREVISEHDFLTLTTEWRRIMGPNSLR